MDLRELVDIWVTGFGVSRRVPVRRLGAVTEVEVGSEKRRLELVLVEPDADVVRHTWERLAGASDIWSTVFTAGLTTWHLPRGVHAELSDELLMTVDLGVHARVEPVVGRVDIEVDGDRAFARVLDGDTVAATGQAAVVGGWAVFDRIGTTDAYRRRGLGTVVMRALESWAVTQGATTGVLAASVDGQRLYAGLGWQRAAAMTTYAAVPGGPGGPGE